MVEITKFYETHEGFKTYVDKYSKIHRTTPENALKCASVREAYHYYRKASRV